MKKKLLYILIALFVIFLISFFVIQNEYIHKSQTYYTNSIKREIQILIHTKQKATFDIAENISVDKKLINIMKHNRYDILYKNPRFFPIYNDYKTFKNIGIHIIDAKGNQKYLSWTKKSLGKNILNARPDLAKILKNPHPTSNISSGLFDITFKGIMPVFDKKHKLLGIVEVITHFNSIVKQLTSQNIYSAVILNKEKSSQIKFNKFGSFIGKYFISNKINPKIKPYLEKNINEFIKINPKTFSYITKNDDFFDGYFIVNVPIMSNNKIFGYFIAFVEDTYTLREKEIFLNIIMILITILFVAMGYIAYTNAKKNEELIKHLNKKVQKEISEKLQLIYKDSLTHTYKKAKFVIDKDKYLNQYVVMLNIKNFSKINELYGFKTGDLVLQIVSKRIEHLLEKKIYRINADEFVFFTKNYKKDIKNIQDIFIHNPIKLQQENLNLKLSFSFAVTKNKGHEILRQLSIALKEAKAKPFRKFIYYKPQELNKDFIKFNSLLYDAILNKDDATIIPYFQAIRDNISGEIAKYESLARLKTEDKIYSPFFFIEIAKSSGFLFEITKIMIDKSFKKISNTDINLSINITEDDLLTFQLKAYLIEKLHQYNLKAQQITLEILEGITSSGTKNNIKQLKELKDIGFKIAIDDFGVEYSNFERINELDVDFIKVDGKYIKNIHINKKSYEITKAITHFAHSLGIKVIAEFVENEEIQQIIDELGIEYSQGYYFSKPKEDL